MGPRYKDNLIFSPKVPRDVGSIGSNLFRLRVLYPFKKVLASKGYSLQTYFNTWALVLFRPVRARLTICESYSLSLEMIDQVIDIFEISESE